MAKRAVKKAAAKKPRKKTDDEIAAEAIAQRSRMEREAIADEHRRELEMRKQYEKERPDIAPWVGWEDYQAARGIERKLMGIGILGAIMGGGKRTEIRKKYHISSDKLNAILNSETVGNVLSYSLGHLYSFQTACVQAILWNLEKDHDGHLATLLLSKMGLFDRMREMVEKEAGKQPEGKAEAVEDTIGFLFSRGDGVQARQARETLERLVVESLKSRDPERGDT
jgi:hypothetical protein